MKLFFFLTNDTQTFTHTFSTKFSMARLIGIQVYNVVFFILLIIIGTYTSHFSCL
ncbi:hypothetical protein HanRHA438_Chr01g0002911 [Helianthus annuus]|nr:hypothetical protein HanRHA438_Chr01g0002911 [Helianthus annuus]